MNDRLAAAPGMTVLAVDGSILRLHCDAASLGLPAARIVRWLRKSARIVAGSYARF